MAFLNIFNHYSLVIIFSFKMKHKALQQSHPPSHCDTSLEGGDRESSPLEGSVRHLVDEGCDITKGTIL